MKQSWGGCARQRAAALSAFLLLLAAAPAAAQQVTCTPTGKNTFVRQVMTDVYFWYRHLPDADPARYDTPEEYLDALRYRPLDASFSYVADRAGTEAFFSSSGYAGFGFSTAFAPGAAPDLRISQVFPGSPADEAGLARGDRIVEIDGWPILDLIRSGRFADALGPPAAGFASELVVARDGERRRVPLVKRAVIIPTVSNTRVFDVGGRRAGYVFFRNFVEPSFEALFEAFSVMQAGGATDVVLDLRYNGGGLVDVAQYLGSLLGGTRTAGQVFAEYFHNDRNAFRNRVLRFETQPGAMRLERLLVITTRGSASASELVINALRPFIPVVVVGDRTYGKPVGQYIVPFCDKVLAPVAFQMRNANGEGDFFDGFAPDCAAPDDLDAPLGDPAEASLREALTVIATGECSAAAAATSRPQRARDDVVPRPAGWDAVLNAH